MNNTQNTISVIQGKLIEVENYIVENKNFTNEDAKIEDINARISEIRSLALTLPKYYSDENYSTNLWMKKTAFLAIKQRISALETKNMSNLEKEIQKIVGYIQLHFSSDTSFDESDHECIWLCPTIISLLRVSTTRAIQLEFDSTAYKAIIESDFTVYDWLVKLAIAEVIHANKDSSFMVLSQLPAGKSHEIIDNIRKEGIAILKNESDKLRYKTYGDLRLRYDLLENSIIPQFEILCNNYKKLVKEIESSGDPSIGQNVCAILLGSDVVSITNQDLVQETVKSVLSIAQIITCYNREIFCSLMKLSSATKYSEVKQQAISFKLSSFVPSCKKMPFNMAFELYQKFLSNGRFKQQEFIQLNRIICDHPEVATASLEQILFSIEQFEAPFVAKKMIHSMAEKGVFSYPGIESLSFSDYASLLRIATQCQCNGVCNDLMQLKQYNIFRPNCHDFQSIIRKSLSARNILVFESLMKHPAFSSLSSGFLKDCIEEVTRNVEQESEWQRILALLTAKIENQLS